LIQVATLYGSLKSPACSCLSVTLPAAAASNLDNFLFQFGLNFALRDEWPDSFVNDISDRHMFSLRFFAKRSHRWLVEAIEHPAAFKNKGRNIARSRFWGGFHAAVSAAFRTRARNFCQTIVAWLALFISIISVVIAICAFFRRWTGRKNVTGSRCTRFQIDRRYNNPADCSNARAARTLLEIRPI
jgi:hypothetical protein